MVDARAVIEAVAAEHGITYAEITGRSHEFRFAHPRQEAMRRLREFGLSYPHIGRILGRDHTTVMAGVRRATERLENPPEPPKAPPKATAAVPPMIDGTPRQVIAKLTKAIAEEHGVLASDMRDTMIRARVVIDARRELIRTVNRLFPCWGMMRIARAIGVHHSTVGYAMNPERRAKKRTYPDHQQFRASGGRSGAETNSEHGHSPSIGAAE